MHSPRIGREWGVRGCPGPVNRPWAWVGTKRLWRGEGLSGSRAIRDGPPVSISGTGRGYGPMDGGEGGVWGGGEGSEGGVGPGV